jgi:hypothetical protein
MGGGTTWARKGEVDRHQRMRKVSGERASSHGQEENRWQGEGWHKSYTTGTGPMLVKRKKKRMSRLLVHH